MSAPFNLKEDLEPALPILNQDDVPANSAACDHNGKDAPANKRKLHTMMRKDKYLADRLANRKERNRKRKRVLRGTKAALPDKASDSIRSDAKLVKAMANLMHTLQNGFENGFYFPIDKISNWIENEEAENLCAVLRLQGSQSRDAARLMGFMLSLVKAVKECRGKYKKGSDDNSDFFEAVAQQVRTRGVAGGGLNAKDFSMEAMSTNTCKVMLESFVKARKAYFLAFQKNSQEGTYTTKTRDLLRILDAWLEFSKEDEDMENGLVENMNEVGI
ncbi:hypothetical protein CKAH01_12073 [Colletotrichum kahawae]|uniref:Uncharacterized protein n=1 Tax=Colletotrichum kahawae TaxID=34407 RepID=A0AAE0DFL1_COLKA|nr:hypothetical protein CKAH01_12073 [Colletotrichum kahawae]